MQYLIKIIYSILSAYIIYNIARYGLIFALYIFDINLPDHYRFFISDNGFVVFYIGLILSTYILFKKKNI